MLCCDDFAINLGQFERGDVTSSWNVKGCCGGGCHVLKKIRFCPYCGHDLTADAPERLREEEKRNG